MKILFPSIFYLPHVVGGIEYYIHNLAKRLLLEGHNVKIVVPEYEDSVKGDYEFEGVKIIRYKSSSSVGILEMSGLEPNDSLEHFKILLKKEKPDIVHFSQITNSSGISLDHIAASKEIGAKVVFTNHMAEFICQRGDFLYMGHCRCDGVVKENKCTSCLMYQRGTNQYLAKIIADIDSVASSIVGKKNFQRQVKPFVMPGFSTRWHIEKMKTAIDLADVYVSIAEWFTQMLKDNKWYKNNCTTIKTGLLNKLSNTENKSDLHAEPLKLIFIGRFFYIKGIDLLIKSVRAIKKESIELNLYFPEVAPNERSYLDYCQQLAKNHENIIFHQEIKNSEVFSVMSQHHILCVPSRSEMAPLVIQEAMAVGIPVIGSDLPAIKEWIIDNYNGLIFEVNNEIELKDKLESIIKNPSLLTMFKQNLPLPRDFQQVVNEYTYHYRKITHSN